MITEAQIEKVIEVLASEDLKDGFTAHNQEYWQYLNSDAFKGISKEEHQLMFFIHSVIYHCLVAEGEFKEFDIETFQQIEDANWQKKQESKDWESAKDLFFEEMSQEEDLLAFIEDMTMDEEITELGGEVIFITTLSYLQINKVN